MKKNYSWEATKDIGSFIFCLLLTIGSFLCIFAEIKESDTWGAIGYGVMTFLFGLGTIGAVADFFDHLTSAIAEKSKRNDP